MAKRLTMKSTVNNGYVLKGMCTFGRDGEPTDELGCSELCETCDHNCDKCPIQEGIDRLAYYENSREGRGFKSKIYDVVLEALCIWGLISFLLIAYLFGVTR